LSNYSFREASPTLNNPLAPGLSESFTLLLLFFD